MYIGINGILPVLLLCVYMRLCVTPAIVGWHYCRLSFGSFKLLAVFALFYKLYTYRICANTAL